MLVMFGAVLMQSQKRNTVNSVLLAFLVSRIRFWENPVQYWPERFRQSKSTTHGKDFGSSMCVQSPSLTVSQRPAQPAAARTEPEPEIELIAQHVAQRGDRSRHVTLRAQGYPSGCNALAPPAPSKFDPDVPGTTYRYLRASFFRKSLTAPPRAEVYDSQEFIVTCIHLGVTPHVAQNKSADSLRHCSERGLCAVAANGPTPSHRIYLKPQFGNDRNSQPKCCATLARIHVW